jgi:hypothetical protein
MTKIPQGIEVIEGPQARRGRRFGAEEKRRTGGGGGGASAPPTSAWPRSAMETYCRLRLGWAVRPRWSKSGWSAPDGRRAREVRIVLSSGNSHRWNRLAVGVFHNRSGCRDRACILEDLLRTLALRTAFNVDGDQNVATILLSSYWSASNSGIPTPS